MALQYTIRKEIIINHWHAIYIKRRRANRCSSWKGKAATCAITAVRTNARANLIWTMLNSKEVYKSMFSDQRKSFLVWTVCGRMRTSWRKFETWLDGFYTRHVPLAVQVTLHWQFRKFAIFFYPNRFLSLSGSGSPLLRLTFTREHRTLLYVLWYDISLRLQPEYHYNIISLILRW